MTSLKLPGRIALAITFFTWAYFLLFIPTFDFDESLYRRVAEEMKLSHQPWRMTWDTWPVYHKPPIFYWLIWGFSHVIDGANSGVSAFAARLPNFFASLGILTALFWGGRKIADDSARSGWVPLLAFICALFPVLTALTVIFDPLQTLALMPSLILPILIFKKDLHLKSWQWILWSLSLFFSCALKGLNGLIIPSLAFALHLLFSARALGFNKNLKLGLRFFFFAFVPGALLTSFFYLGLDHWIGRPFTEEFLWVQHFKRSQIPMEEHSGSFFYHFLILFFGGGFIIPLLIDRMFRTPIKYSSEAFPLTYTFTFLLVFSFTATKLPHYTWPVWPALAIYFGILLSNSVLAKPVKVNEFLPLDRFQRVLSFFPVLILGVSMLALAFQAELILPLLSQNSRYQMIVKHFEGFNLFEKAALYIGAIACFFAQFNRRKVMGSIEHCALLASITSFCLVVGLGRTATSFMVKPYVEIVEALHKHGVTLSDCIRSSGAQSPTFSLALGNTLSHNRCEPGVMKFLVAPEWKSQECEERGLIRLEQKSYLVLCGKK